jgi:hypothetical protein
VTGVSDGNSIYTALLQNNGTAVDTASKLLFVQGGSTVRGAAIGGLQEASAGSPTSMVFETSASYATPTERMRIDSSGNVGIGTDSPGAALEVNSGGGIHLSDDTAGRTLIIKPSLSGAIHEFTSDNTSAGYSFSNNASELMRIDNSGNVGIGTTTPTAPLQVVGMAEHTDNAAAITAGLTVGAFYRTGDLLKVVH